MTGGSLKNWRHGATVLLQQMVCGLLAMKERSKMDGACHAVESAEEGIAYPFTNSIQQCRVGGGIMDGCL